jgi:glyceraldehyde 3-phosphate dehydrogenase
MKVGINGFGRIGKLVLRASLEKNFPEVEFVAINDIADTKTLAHLFKYDSNYGTFEGEIVAKEDALVINGKEYKVFSEKNPSDIRWDEKGVDVVVESTGFFTEAEKAKGHLTNGVKKVLISAPAKGEDITIVLGVNEQDYDPSKHTVLSNASCTTNCLAPVVKVLDEVFGVAKGLMTTIHSYTNDQRILDLPHKDPRRARAGAVSMIPTSTGAAIAIGKVIPSLKGKLDGYSMRVPTPTVSVVDLVAELKNSASVESVNSAFKKASETTLKDILGYSNEPLVSKDYVKDPHSAVIDSLSTYIVERNLIKVLAWYDNEWAYSCRVVDLLKYMAGKQ